MISKVSTEEGRGRNKALIPSRLAIALEVKKPARARSLRAARVQRSVRKRLSERSWEDFRAKAGIGGEAELACAVESAQKEQRGALVRDRSRGAERDARPPEPMFQASIVRRANVPIGLAAWCLLRTRGEKRIAGPAKCHR